MKPQKTRDSMTSRMDRLDVNRRPFVQRGASSPTMASVIPSSRKPKTNPNIFVNNMLTADDKFTFHDVIKCDRCLAAVDSQQKCRPIKQNIPFRIPKSVKIQHAAYILSLVIFILMSNVCEGDSSRRRLDEDHHLQLHAPEDGSYPDQSAIDGLQFKVSKAFKPTVQFGQITGVSLAKSGHVVVFHRGTHVWDGRSFHRNNSYALRGEGPINVNTILELELEPDTGILLKSWGSGLFYLPHGLTIDAEGNYWLTDVALHQVFKFGPKGGTSPLLTIGKDPFVPGSDEYHFCKPTSVAVHSTDKNVFIADGYCNNRVVQYSPDGTFINQFSHQQEYSLGYPMDAWDVTHKVIIIEEMNVICVADRENGRIQCLNIRDGRLWISIPKKPNHPIYSISYSPTCRLMFAIEGPNSSGKQHQVLGFAARIDNGQNVAAFAPPNGVDRNGNEYYSFSRPHDIVVSDDCTHLYVVEIGPNRIFKFLSNLSPEPSTSASQPRSLVVTPAAEVASDTHIDPQGNTASQAPQDNKSSSPFYFMLSMVAVTGIVIVYRYRHASGSSSSFARPFFLPLLPRCLTMLMARTPRSGRGRDSFDLSRLLEDPERSGFNRVSTTETDIDDGDVSGDSEIEEFNVTSVRNGKLSV